MIMKRYRKFKHNHRKNNQGNSFIMVVATLSFLAVLVAAILVAVALCYRLKAYDINARDNFYYLEEAMDEIYAGVGADAMLHLNKAYQDTIEVLVYYDAENKAYVTMSNKEANAILKNAYMQKVKDDNNYKSNLILEAHLNSFLSNPYETKSYDALTNTITKGSTTNPEGIELSVDNVGTTSDELTIYGLILKREAKYSTVNTRKDAAQGSGGDTFVQTITTDLIIRKPEFDVDFNTIGSELSNLYSFSLIADKGIEITNPASNVNITGNIYAASDFYNKTYNKNNDTRVCAYNSPDEDGIKEKSMYSGIYINGADVIISSDMLVVPGTIAAFNGANVAIAGSNQISASSSTIWADGITLGGYSLKKSASSDDVVGSVMNVRANAYISDDLELNATSSRFNMVGNYYGYNYASTDNRKYSDSVLAANNKRTFVDSVLSNSVKDGSTIDGQAHYNSSAIIVNGEDSEMDLSGVENMYIAGQAYIETSKVTKASNKDAGGNEIMADNKNIKNDAGEPTKENVTVSTYEYPEYDATVADDNYTTSTDAGYYDGTSGTVSPKQSGTKTNIQDYRTGEAISIKSNQLAYIPPSNVTDNTDSTGELYVSLPNNLRNLDLYKKYWSDLSKIPVVKTVISGKKYYFFDFSTAATPDPNDSSTDASLKQGIMNSFMEDYAALFKKGTGDVTSVGEDNGLTNITEYDPFQIKMLKINTPYKTNINGEITDVLKENGEFKNIYSNSAITVKADTSFTIKAKSNSIEPLINVAKSIDEDIDVQKNSIDSKKTEFDAAQSDLPAAEQKANPYDSSKTIGYVSSSTDTSVKAADITKKLQSKYKEAKWMLSTKSSDATAVYELQDRVDASGNVVKGKAEDEITPINYFFNFNLIEEGTGLLNHTKVIERLSSGFKLWITAGDFDMNSGDVVGSKTIITKDDFADGNVKGVIISKGDVVFDSDVKSFEGLIITGGKIIVDHSMNISANDEIIKTVLRECDESILDTTSTNKKCYLFCQLLKHYTPTNTSGTPTSLTTVETVSAKDITSVQYEDVLAFDNWRKNVD